MTQKLINRLPEIGDVDREAALKKCLAGLADWVSFP